MKLLVDSHMHLDMIERYSFCDLQWYRNNRNVIISWSFFKNIKKSSQLEFYLYNQGHYVRQISKKLNVKCFYLTGVHPRNIPSDVNINLKNIEDILFINIFDEFCLGIGEIGLETSSPVEIKLFKIQLKMIKKVRKNIKIGIHTPKNNKVCITKKIIKILNKYSEIQDNVLIDHSSEKTLHIILKEGYMAGVTVDPLKINLLLFASIVKKCNKTASGIILNSDNGGSFSIFFFKKVSELKKKLGSKICKKMYFENSNRFFEFVR